MWTIGVFRRVSKIPIRDYELCHACTSVRPSQWNILAPPKWMDFSRNLKFEYFSKIVKKIQILVKFDKNDS
jgi:hypothetical protein